MKLLTIAIKRVLSYFEIVISQPSLPILLRDKMPARMTLPTLAITDPKFVYKNASCTDITQTFQKAKDERLQRLRNDADVPMDGRSFVIPPVLRNALMGTDRYTEQA